MIEKKKVEKNFGKSVRTYNSAAKVQEYMADMLMKKIDETEEEISIYEIGCGTGLFTDKIIKKIPNSRLMLVDISKNMIEYAKERYCKNEKITYLNIDAEKYISEKKYDLVVSNAVFQWFENLDNATSNINKSIKNNGKLYFSTFAEETFTELNDVFQTFGEEYRFSQKFYSKKEIESIMCKHFTTVKINEDYFIEEYDNLMEFLSAIKKIGANSAVKNAPFLTKKIIKKAEEIYKTKYSIGEKIKVTNHLVFVEAYN